MSDTTRRLIRQVELFTMLGMSRASGHRAIAAGKIGPEPMHLAGIRYDLDEVNAWIRDGRCCDRRTWLAMRAQRGRLKVS